MRRSSCAMSKVVGCAEEQPSATGTISATIRNSERVAVSSSTSGDDLGGCCDLSGSMQADKNWRSGVHFWLQTLRFRLRPRGIGIVADLAGAHTNTVVATNTVSMLIGVGPVGHKRRAERSS